MALSHNHSNRNACWFHCPLSNRMVKNRLKPIINYKSFVAPSDCAGNLAAMCCISLPQKEHAYVTTGTLAVNHPSFTWKHMLKTIWKTILCQTCHCNCAQLKLNYHIIYFYDYCYNQYTHYPCYIRHIQHWYIDWLSQSRDVLNNFLFLYNFLLISYFLINVKVSVELLKKIFKRAKSLRIMSMSDTVFYKKYKLAVIRELCL